jgi:hypothetical protein
MEFLLAMMPTGETRSAAAELRIDPSGQRRIDCRFKD